MKIRVLLLCTVILAVLLPIPVVAIKMDLYPMDKGSLGGGGGGVVVETPSKGTSANVGENELTATKPAEMVARKNDDPLTQEKKNEKSLSPITEFSSTLTPPKASFNSTTKKNPFQLDTLKEAEYHSAPTNMMDIIKSEPEIRQQYLDYLKNILKRETEILNERKRLIDHGLWIGHSMWLMANFLVLFCTYLSFREFSTAQKIRKLDASQEIKISLEGIALKTTLHGVVLLALAMCFYFLYLKFVYLPGI